jgi:3-deoxy-7-phosphoheptulonate synthase
MFRALRQVGIQTTRAGAYKPRTSPYDFQGHGKACLRYVFELAGKHGIKVISMEITHESHVEEIHEALEQAGQPSASKTSFRCCLSAAWASRSMSR